MGELVSADHAGLVDALCASGAVDGDWADAFRAVPRDLFVPDAVWTGLRSPLLPVARRDDPARWWALVHSDVALVTQVDDGAIAAGRPGRYPTSSISQPSLVAMMLARARLELGHRVLEIGTGTRYNAALLAHRLGATAVCSVEIDPALAGAARVALEKAGCGALTVIIGDGALGHPPGAPYDRVLSTATCHRVPRAWVEQTRLGGRIVTPWASSYHNGALLHLDVGDDGVASGCFGGNVSFMWLFDPTTCGTRPPPPTTGGSALADLTTTASGSPSPPTVTNTPGWISPSSHSWGVIATPDTADPSRMDRPGGAAMTCPRVPAGGVLRFEGWIAGLGTTAGLRVVIGHWTSSPWGPFTDVMVEQPDGHRVLLAPTPTVAGFIAGTYQFDDVRTVGVDATVDGARWQIMAPPIEITFDVGGRPTLGLLLRAVPRWVAASPRWIAAIDRVARQVLPGVRTRGSAGGGAEELYAALDLHRIVGARVVWGGVDQGSLAPVTPPVRFGFGSTPPTPSLVHMITLVRPG